jgi:hypothetical protein
MYIKNYGFAKIGYWLLVLLIGTSLNIPDNISALGFTFSDKIKVLGMDISRNPDDWDENFSRILGGINK